MCGITLSIYPVSPTKGPDQAAIALHESLASSNANRGPDTSDTWTQVVDVEDGGRVEIRLTSSVLGLRGELTGQPVRGKRGVLAWNGQVFHGLDIQQDENDTMAIFRQLEAGRDIHELLSNIEGPYAFVYYEFASRTLMYQLDLLSRRALLQHFPSTSGSYRSRHPDTPSLADPLAEMEPKVSSQPSTSTPPSTPASTSIPSPSPSALSSRYFALSSTRSSLARREQIHFRALGGGEGGVLNLSKIRIRRADVRIEGSLKTDGEAQNGQPAGLVGDTIGEGKTGRAEEEFEFSLDGALRTWDCHTIDTALTRIPLLNTNIPDADYLPSALAAEAEVDRFIEELTASVSRRVSNIPVQKNGAARAALLFSGGVDSTLLAYMLHKCLPPDEPIDLVNVAFQRNPDLPTDGNKHFKNKNKYGGAGQGKTKGAGADCKKGKKAGTGSGARRSSELAEEKPDALAVRADMAETDESELKVQAVVEPGVDGLDGLDGLGSLSLESAPPLVAASGPATEHTDPVIASDPMVTSTVPTFTPPSSSDVCTSPTPKPSSTADSRPPPDPAPKGNRKQKLPNGLTESEHARMVAEHEYNVPDRIAGYEAVQELRACCAGREFRFVTVDVTYAGYMAHREQVMDLMYPCTTEMDMSLAYPLYFASRGKGTVDGRGYQVEAKVYFSGLGPDEQLGGYSRHRNAYLYPSYPEISPIPTSPTTSHPLQAPAAELDIASSTATSTSAPPTCLIPSPTQTQRYSSLLSSLTSELSRLPTRNTSRDDRALSHWARDARYPYLDLQFIAYLSALPIQAKVVYELGEGVGDKLLLRLAARKVGLEKSAKRVKRAMQFGSRSAKVGGKGKGPGAGRRTVEE